VTSEAGKARDYRDLLVWQKGISLAKAVYEITRQFPADERFGLISQMMRAAISVPSNIAEGQARRTSGEFVQSLSHAEGSLAELDTQLVLSTEFRYCETNQAAKLHEAISELRKMLNSLRRKISERRR
jgi:four helix bundle protein